MKKVTLLDMICHAFMFLFIYTAVSKLLEHDLFRSQIGKSPLLSPYAGIISWFVPLSELMVAAMLPLSRLRLTALCASFLMMLVFTGYVWSILTFSPYVPCSCGGILSTMGWTEHLIFNIVFSLLAAAGILLHARENSVPNASINETAR